MKYQRPKRTYKKRTKNQLATKQYVRQELNRGIETKHYPSQFYGQVSSTGSIKDLSDIAVGTQAYERLGDEVDLVAIDIKYNGFLAPSLVLGQDEYITFRVVLFRWYDNSTPTMASILDANSATDVTAVYEKSDHQRYHIVYDSSHTIFSTPVYTGTLVFEHGPFSSYTSPYIRITGRKLGKKTAYYNVGGATGNDHLYALIVTDSAIVPHPAVELNAVLSFKDA